jgi:hypothetical protein
MNIANLLHIRSYTHRIYNLTITAIGNITITYPVVIAMHSIQLTSATAAIQLNRYKKVNVKVILRLTIS